jgi:hypothetical protein
MGAATDLCPFAPVADLSVLTALERAEPQKIGPGPRRRDIAEHLGFRWNSGTGRKLNPLLLALEAEGLSPSAQRLAEASSAAG